MTFSTKICSHCKGASKPVERQTVKALVSISLRGVYEENNYYFCSDASCPVVYFSDNGIRTFTVDQIRERIYQKEPDSDDVLLCYCFQYTVGSVKNASKECQQEIIEDINTGIKAGQCACDLRNPQGSCCLGNIRTLIRSLS